MKNICINSCILSCIIFASCSQNRYYTTKVLENPPLKGEAISSTELEAIEQEFNENPATQNSDIILSSNENLEAGNTKLVEFIDNEHELSEPVQLAQVDEDLSIGVPADNVISNTLPSEHSLDDLELLAINNHPEIQQSLADVSAVKGQQYQVTRKFNPVIGYQAQEVGNEGKAGQQGVYVSQTFVTANKLGLNGQIQGHLAQMKSWDWKVKELDIRNKVQQNFYEYQGAVLKLNLANKLLKISEESSGVVQLLLDSGESKKSQKLQADIQVNRSLIVVNNQKQNVKASFTKLIAAVGIPGLENDSVTGSLPKNFPIYNWDELYSNMISSHPSIQSARSQVQSANWAIRRAEVQKIPNIQSQLGLLYDTSTLDTIMGIQVGGALPVHNKNRGNIRSRYADYMKAVQEVERVKLSLKAELANAYQMYETNRLQSDNFKKQILPKAEESLDLITQGFQQGQDPYIQLLIAQRTYFESNQEFVDILISVNRGMADLRKLKSIE